MRRVQTIAAVGCAAALSLSAGAGAATLEPVGSFDRPVFVTSEPADPNALLIVQQSGQVILAQGGARTTVLDLTDPDPDLVVSGGEQGLLSVAAAPDYAISGHLYVYYTRAGSGDVQIDEFTVVGDRAPLSSRRPVLTIPHRAASNHNGGQLQFGTDGYLYIGTGDGGGAGDPGENAQSLASRLGKILRIDPRSSAAGPYAIPAGNPFADGAGGNADEIWSWGLRNPWRFSFDRLGGDLLIGDVGQNEWEELDFDPAPRAGRGVNFGWDCREGRHGFEASGCGAGLTDPMLEYPHSGGEAAVTGGYVVRDRSVADLYGRYLYADAYGAEIRSLLPALPNAADDRPTGLRVQGPVSFGEDSCGRVYVVSLLGEVSRLAGDSPAVCPSGTPAPPPRCGGRVATMAAEGRLKGTTGPDVIVGSPGKDKIRGGRGRDLICARAGRDRLLGGPGKDRLRGGHGKDRCAGGPGRDRRRSC
jgi:glucose/arabinose dehydrogenase